MRKYIWLNPIVISSYNLLDLETVLSIKKYTIVYPKKNHAEIVLNKYKNLEKKF